MHTKREERQWKRLQRQMRFTPAAAAAAVVGDDNDNDSKAEVQNFR